MVSSWVSWLFWWFHMWMCGWYRKWALIGKCSTHPNARPPAGKPTTLGYWTLATPKTSWTFLLQIRSNMDIIAYLRMYFSSNFDKQKNWRPVIFSLVTTIWGVFGIPYWPEDRMQVFCTSALVSFLKPEASDLGWIGFFLFFGLPLQFQQVQT